MLISAKTANEARTRVRIGFWRCQALFEPAAPVVVGKAPPLAPPLTVAGEVAEAWVAEAEVVFVVVLLGPVKKKFPAIGLPKLTASAKVVKLKLFLGVDELTKAEAAVSKSAGWTKSTST